MPWNDTIVDSQILAVHAALVPSGPQGEVVLFGGDEHWADQQESAGGGKFKKTRLYDVASHALTGGSSIPSPDSDVFCAHHAFTSDGRLLICGGTSKWPEGADPHAHDLDFLGHNRTWVYRAHARRWDEVARLNRNPAQPDEPNSGGRWYPGCVTLGNGDVLALFGHPLQGDHRHRNVLPERYSLGANVWLNALKAMAEPLPPGGSIRPLFFPRMFVLPDGRVFIATPMPVLFASAVGGDGPYLSTRYDPASGDYVGHQIPQPADGGYHGWDSPAVLLPLLPPYDSPRVLFCGAPQPIRINLGDPTGEWQNTAGRDASVAALRRTFSNAVVLPTGQVCVVGGVNAVSPEQGVPRAELYNPGIDWAAGTYAGADSWSVDADPAQHTRNYHSTALLLPNGKVWTAGGNVNASPGNPDTVGVKKIELYEPPYVAVANRLQVTAWPLFAGYGQTFGITLDRPATDVQRVALIRAGSATHSTNNDQRYVGLSIAGRTGNTMRVVAPPNGNVAPPGYYTLWAVDSANNPSQLGRFVRLGHVHASVFTNRSTFSGEEVESIGGGGPATFDEAVYLQVDGYRDIELTATPSVTVAWADDDTPVPQVTLIPHGRLLEVGPTDHDVTQRVQFPFDVRFADTSPWATFTDTRTIRMTFTLGPVTAVETIELTKSPNPYMVDIDPAVHNPGWLSADIRVFFTSEGSTNFPGLTQQTGPGAGRTFIKALLDRFNNAPNNPSHPFLSLPSAQESSKLVLATDIFGLDIFNYAVAKVRYRATTTQAQNVKVFFRMFNTVGTALEYDPNGTYDNTGPGPGTVPLLGRAGAEIASIPFFIAERVETVQGRPGATAMTAQTLDAQHEIRTIAPVAGAEATMYFGCYLDINQTRKRFPISPGASNGPWPEADCRSIQELMRAPHQCLVAEIYFEPDPTDPGRTPGTSDNLSQRNIAFLVTDNPGGPDAHTCLHTFEVRPSSLFQLPAGAALEAVPPGAGLVGEAGAGVAGELFPSDRFRPDELFFRWHNLPDDTDVTLHFSDIDTDEVARLAALRLSPPAFTVVDKHTVTFRVGDSATMPLPGGRTLNIPALVRVQMPDTVRYGETYRISVHQIDGRSGQTIGSFEITIPVSDGPLMLENEQRDLSVLKHIATTIPPGNRWHPIFQRYIHGLGGKVDALGGDSASVQPNPDGSGRPYVPKPDPGGAPPAHGGLGHCLEAWAVALIVALGLVLLGVVGSAGARAVVAVVALVLLALVVYAWSVRCHGRIRCALLDHVLLGAAVAAGVLSILLVSHVAGTFLTEAIAIAAVLAALAAIASFALRCRGA
jgi:hypothetical protein